MPTADRDKWNARYRRQDLSREAPPSAFLVSLANRLPRQGRALDIAGGAGRNALWLAEHGLEVTLVDIASAGLELASERACTRKLALTTLERDLVDDGLPEGPWDVIVSVLFLSRSIFEAIPPALQPGGLFIFLQPTVQNLERHAKPPRPFLLELGELRTLLGPELHIEHLEESWSADGFHEARLLASKR